MRLRLVLGIVGQLLRMFSAVYIVPVLYCLLNREWDELIHFIITGIGTFAVGGLFAVKLPKGQFFYRAEALGVVAFSWLAVGLSGAVPFMLAGLSPFDAMFESISGFTTTGATILADFSPYGKGFFLWRAMTQWFGGLGVIALFVVVLPRLGIAGRQLFFAEASAAPGEAVSPQVKSSSRRLWALYSLMTLVLSILLMFCGFGLYDAIVHAFTTMAAGGFSPNPESIAGFHNPAAEWVLTVFMLAAGASFPLQYKIYTGKFRSALNDGEFLMYTGVAVGISLLLAVVLNGWSIPDESQLRAAAFQVTSLISSTGFASTDYNLWADSARTLLILVMLVGGCAGSAAGGPKVVRLLLVFKHVAREMTRVLHPRAVIPVKYKGKAVPNEIIRAVFHLVVLFMLCHFFVGTLLALSGNDLVLSYTASLACVGNVGPAFGIAGPMGSFAAFGNFEKAVLTIAMWLGRLEIVTALALLHPDVWRNLRWDEAKITH